MSGRALRGVTDVLAVEETAPGLVRVVTMRDVYTVDARDAGCHCEDHQYNLGDGERCKHDYAAVLATSADLPAPWPVAEDLDEGPEPLPDFEDFELGVEYA